MCRIETVNLSDVGIAMIMFEDELDRNQNKINRLRAEVRAKSQELNQLMDRQSAIRRTLVNISQNVASSTKLCYNNHTR